MKLAIYDFDSTYINTQTLTILYKLWQKKHLNDRLYRYYWHRILRRYLYQKLHLFGWTKTKFKAYAMKITGELFKAIDKTSLFAFLEEFYQELQPYISKTMKEQLQEDNDKGYHTVLLSGNFDIILEPFLKEGFKQVIGSDFYVDGKFIPLENIEIIIGPKKKQVIEQRFPTADYQQSRAYADSDHDLPLLELVGYPVAVNPDKRLLAIAKAKGFEIIDTK